MCINERMPNAATVSVIVNSKEIVNNKVIQGVAAYQYEPECFQINTFQAHGNYQQDSNVGDFVQFTGKLIYENEILTLLTQRFYEVRPQNPIYPITLFLYQLQL